MTNKKERGEAVTKGRETRNAGHETFIARGYQEDSPKDDDDHYLWDDRLYQPELIAGYSKPAGNSSDGLYHTFGIYDDGSWYHYTFNTKRRGERWVLVGSGSGKDDLLSHLNSEEPA
jgi:hypothetical protein